jgi:hypothetical protein
MYFVVIRPWGYMESVEKEDINPEDEVVFECETRKKCEKFIHTC